MWFLCLCKLTQVFSIVLVLNRSPSGSTYQLSLVHLFVSPSPSLSFFSSTVSLSITFFTFDIELLYLAWIIDVLRGCFSVCLHSTMLLPCILLHDSLLCVRSFGCCRRRAGRFPSPLIYLSSSSFPPHDSPSPVSPLITSAHCEFASCLSLLLPSLSLFSQLFTHPERHFSYSCPNLTCPACLRFECPPLISFLPSALCSSPPLSVVYLHRERWR